MGIRVRSDRHLPRSVSRGSVGPLCPARTAVADALFSSIQHRVLALLFGQPERSFHAAEIIERTGSGSGAVQRELHRLGESGLVNVTRLGNQKHYQANASAPIFNELRGIFDKTLGIAGTLRLALSPFEQDIRFAAIYGSVAKRADSARSGIDVLVVATDLTLEQIYGVLASAEKRLGRAVNPTLYTPEEFQRRFKAGQPFLKKVLEGQHIVLMGSEDAVGAGR